MLPRGRVYRYPPSRNMQTITLPGVAGGAQALATALANAHPEQQRTVRPVSGYCF